MRVFSCGIPFLAIIGGEYLNKLFKGKKKIILLVFLIMYFFFSTLKIVSFPYPLKLSQFKNLKGFLKRHIYLHKSLPFQKDPIKELFEKLCKKGGKILSNYNYIMVHLQDSNKIEPVSLWSPEVKFIFSEKNISTIIHRLKSIGINYLLIVKKDPDMPILKKYSPLFSKSNTLSFLRKIFENRILIVYFIK